MAAFFHALSGTQSWNARFDTNKKIPSLRKAGEGIKEFSLRREGFYIPRAFFACTDTAFSGSSSISFSR